MPLRSVERAASCCRVAPDRITDDSASGPRGRLGFVPLELDAKHPRIDSVERERLVICLDAVVQHDDHVLIAARQLAFRTTARAHRRGYEQCDSERAEQMPVRAQQPKDV